MCHGSQPSPHDLPRADEEFHYVGQRVREHAHCMIFHYLGQRVREHLIRVVSKNVEQLRKIAQQ